MSISPRFDGTLREVYVEIGDRVEASQPLAELDTFSIEQDLERARKALAITKCQLGQAEAQREWDHYNADWLEGLRAEERASEQEKRQAAAIADQSDQQVKIIEATIEQENARIAQLEAQLENATIQAPVSGVVGARYREPGATVGRGTPILRLVSLDELWVRFAVEEEDGACVQPGGPVTVHVEALEEAVSGTIEHVAPEVDAALGIMLVEAKLVGDQELTDRLKPGMVARVFISGTRPLGPPHDPPARQALDQKDPGS